MDEPRPQALQEAPEPLSGGSVTVPELSEDGGDADTAQLLAGQPQPRGFWTFEFYQAFFDVDTRQVLERIRASLVPVPGKNFVRHRLRNNPDLYGPFWIGATLALALALSADLSQLGPARPGPAHRYRPRFRLVPVALSLVFSYAGLLPLALRGSLRWARGGSGGSLSLLQTPSTFGYSLSGLVPAAVLWALPLAWLRWALLALPGATLAVTWGHPRCHLGPPSLSPGATLAVTRGHPRCHLGHPRCHPGPPSLSPSGHTCAPGAGGAALLALGCQLYFLEPLPALGSGSGSGGAPTGGIPPINASHPAR